MNKIEINQAPELSDVVEFSANDLPDMEIRSKSCQNCGGNCNNCGGGNCSCQSCGNCGSCGSCRSCMKC